MVEKTILKILIAKIKQIKLNGYTYLKQLKTKL